jgi:hypothetical protein
VNDKFQQNGLGWLTLDEAIQKQFNRDEVWGLPDIPGWSKSHLLTSAEQIADIKRQALAQAKPKAVGKIADKVAAGIVDKLGPKIGEDIGKDLGIENPFSDGRPNDDAPAEKRNGKNAPPQPNGLLQFKRLDDDRDKVRYGDEGGQFMIYQYQDGSGLELFQLNKDGGWTKFEEVFPTFEAAVQFATTKSK